MKTVLALLDYSKAFDRVWREDLLIRAIDKGLPITYAQWLRDLENTASRAVSSTPQTTKLALYGQDPNKQITR